jgi:hypothetical protein
MLRIAFPPRSAAGLDQWARSRFNAMMRLTGIVGWSKAHGPSGKSSLCSHDPRPHPSPNRFIVVAQFLPSLFQAQTLAKKNRRELKGLVGLDSNGETVKAEMKQVGEIISARRF